VVETRQLSKNEQTETTTSAMSKARPVRGEQHSLTCGSPEQAQEALVTYGGYSDSILVDEGFVLHTPANANLAENAPLLCACVTAYLAVWMVPAPKGRRVSTPELKHRREAYATLLPGGPSVPRNAS
jgi:D-arabinose 1-dehydrogenase-like Zn-dependent alcohol dehydrogenase